MDDFKFGYMMILMAIYRSKEGLIKACNQINKALPADAKHKVTHFPVNVSDRTSCTELVQNIFELYGMLVVYIYYIVCYLFISPNFFIIPKFQF